MLFGNAKQNQKLVYNFINLKPILKLRYEIYWSIRLSLLQLFKVNFALLLHEYIRKCALLSPSRDCFTRPSNVNHAFAFIYAVMYSYLRHR